LTFFSFFLGGFEFFFRLEGLPVLAGLCFGVFVLISVLLSPSPFCRDVSATECTRGGP
jgi:hypothetical protein